MHRLGARGCAARDVYVNVGPDTGSSPRAPPVCDVINGCRRMLAGHRRRDQQDARNVFVTGTAGHRTAHVRATTPIDDTNSANDSVSAALTVNPPPGTTHTFSTGDSPCRSRTTAPSTCRSTSGRAGNVLDVDAVVRLDHTFDSDLDMFLDLAGGGTTVELSTDNGGGGDNYGSGTNDCSGAEDPLQRCRDELHHDRIGPVLRLVQPGGASERLQWPRRVRAVDAAGHRRRRGGHRHDRLREARSSGALRPAPVAPRRGRRIAAGMGSSSPSTRRPASSSGRSRRSRPTRSRPSSTTWPRCSRSGRSSRSPTAPVTCAGPPTSSSPTWRRSRTCSPASRASRSPRATSWR